jgi:hypothetical protein
MISADNSVGRQESSLAALLVPLATILLHSCHIPTAPGDAGTLGA